MENNSLCVQIVLFHLYEHLSYPLRKGFRISEDALYYDHDIDDVVSTFHWDSDGTFTQITRSYFLQLWSGSGLQEYC